MTEDEMMWIEIRLEDLKAAEVIVKRGYSHVFAFLVFTAIAVGYYLFMGLIGPPQLRHRGFALTEVFFFIATLIWFFWTLLCMNRAKEALYRYHGRWGKLDPGEAPAMTTEVRLLVAEWKLRRDAGKKVER